MPDDQLEVFDVVAENTCSVVPINDTSLHGLLDIIDPLGRRIIRNVYDDDGRLTAQEDNEGNRTEFNHNIHVYANDAEIATCCSNEHNDS